MSTSKALKPWREVITPRDDVLNGTFSEAEFAADLTKVMAGAAVAEYQEPKLFFERTFITEGMSLLLQSVIARLSGQGGDPVVQLQTAFGGGKTHTMMAVLHMVRAEEPVGLLAGLGPVLSRAGASELPRGRVAVLDGNQLAPSQPRVYETPAGAVTVRTLWGELAWQLLGAEGYELVAAADRDGTSPGKDALGRLFAASAPCVVLMDEMVAYLRQFEEHRSYAGGTYNSNLSFIQALTEAASATPRTMVLASLPESRTEAGDERGQATLDALEKYFGRIEAVWKPVAKQEAFEIVRRRLFNDISDHEGRRDVCDAFAALYQDEKLRFPVHTVDSDYRRQLGKSYPIHPEVFERLYEDWSTLPKFQRTRGVLRLMARIIHQLWRADNRDLMILPGSIPLDESKVRNELVKYLPAGWDAIVDRDIDGPQATPRRLDENVPALGSVSACRRAARTVFLGSAPSVSAQKVRGIGVEHVRLGCAQPGQTIGRYDDALHRLDDTLHYLYSGNQRYWFDSRPNLRREMEERVQRLSEGSAIHDELQARLEQMIQRGTIRKIHVFRSSQDIEDKEPLRLVVLEPEQAHKRRDVQSAAVRAALQVVERHGESTRSMQNRVIFLAAERESVGALREQIGRYLAWKSIVEDKKLLNLDEHNRTEAERNQKSADERLQGAIKEAYKWLLAPMKEVNGKGQAGEVIWEEAELSVSRRGFADAIDEALRESEWVIDRWAPTFLGKMLARWYFREDQPHVGVARVWNDMCRTLYMPRLASSDVLLQTIREGLGSQDFFGYAAGRDNGRYQGLMFGHSGAVYLDDSALLIAPDVAAAQAALQQAARPAAPVVNPGTAAAAGSGQTSSPAEPVAGGGLMPVGKRMRRFHASVELEPLNAVFQLTDIVENVIEHFTAQYGVAVNITLDIAAESADGFDPALQRTVKENCATLSFKHAEFEEE